MKKSIFNKIEQLQKEDNKLEIIEILQKFLKNKNTNSIMDRGWAYWNISDNYALLRMPNEEYKNHMKFVGFIIEELPKEMLYWSVSDATQKLTLIKGGYGEFWYDLYVTACNTAPKTNENCGIRFESHRAAISEIGPQHGRPNIENSEFALNNIKNLINKNPLDYNIRFYTITYYSLSLIVNTYLKMPLSETIDKAMESFNALIPYLEKDVSSDEIIGTWEQLNLKHPLNIQAKVGMNNLICNLIDTSQYKLALDCYKIFEEKRIPTNDYFKSRIEYAKSNL